MRGRTTIFTFLRMFRLIIAFKHQNDYYLSEIDYNINFFVITFIMKQCISPHLYLLTEEETKELSHYMGNSGIKMFQFS